MDNQSKLEFIPFHAINEFMRNDFRLNIIRKTLREINRLDRKYREPIDQLTKKHVKVAGFRNSTKAPVTARSVAMVKTFEKQPQLVATILSAWAEIQPVFRQQMFDLLADRGWKLLPLSLNRARLPGFLTQWPLEDDFDTLYEAFISVYPETRVSMDETSLMAVWISNRLPIEKVSKEQISMPAITPETEDPSNN